jgi:hypothetical protein
MDERIKSTEIDPIAKFPARGYESEKLFGGLSHG